MNGKYNKALEAVGKTACDELSYRPTVPMLPQEEAVNVVVNIYRNGVQDVFCPHEWSGKCVAIEGQVAQGIMDFKELLCEPEGSIVILPECPYKKMKKD